MTVKTIKRFTLGEISGVDRPAQPHALAVIMKSASPPTLSDLIINAKAISVQGSQAARYTAAQFETGMMDLASQQAAQKGTTTEMELANGWGNRDSDLFLLGHVWSQLNIVEYRPKVSYQ
jgi:hypothetical protein